jgi:Fe-S-cluster containining protein
MDTDRDRMSESPLPAGEFSEWLAGMQAALRGDADSDVPCGSCTACCTSSQFVHIEPDEIETLAFIPAELLFPAPGQPIGHVVMGYDQDGRCPMLTEAGCSIYEHRPRTCRVYDCRLFVALGRVNEDTPLIAQRIRAWEFTFADDAGREVAKSIRESGRLPEAP